MKKLLAFCAVSLLFSIQVKAELSLSDKDIYESYVYQLGRDFVVRQEITDIREVGVDYNMIKYNPLGSADFVNPNLDVAYMESWIAVDNNSATVLEIPQINGRYYTAQILDEWGEVIANINERNFPQKPFGKYALVSPNSTVKLPSDITPVVMHSYKAKMLARVELQTDWDEAEHLQKQFKMYTIGTPVIKPPVQIPMFNNKALMGIELFETAPEVLKTAIDVSPAAAQMQAKVLTIAEEIAKDKEAHAELKEKIKTKFVPQFVKESMMKAGIFKNNWLGTMVAGNYGDNYFVRTAANRIGIWANSPSEVVYFVSTRDAQGKSYNGSNTYLLDFPADALPQSVVDGYWSVILVDLPNFRVAPNELNRYNFNSYSDLKFEKDGSLRIYISATKPKDVAKSNWLPAPVGKMFSLTLRSYIPKTVVKEGEWFPPAVKKITQGLNYEK